MQFNNKNNFKTNMKSSNVRNNIFYHQNATYIHIFCPKKFVWSINSTRFSALLLSFCFSRALFSLQFNKISRESIKGLFVLICLSFLNFSSQFWLVLKVSCPIRNQKTNLNAQGLMKLNIPSPLCSVIGNWTPFWI